MWVKFREGTILMVPSLSQPLVAVAVLVALLAVAVTALISLKINI